MSIARSIKYVFPAGARAALKKRYPDLIESLAFGLDSIPIALDARRWPKLLNPKTLHHPLNTRMWSGFGEVAARDLDHLKVSGLDRRRVVAATAWPLVRWHASREDYERALDNLLLMIAALPKVRRNPYTQLMMVECLLQLDRPEDARRWLRWASKGVKQPRPEFYLSAANVSHALALREGDASRGDSERLAWLNRAYKEAGFSKIAKIDENRELSLDNITCTRRRPIEASAKLSVLMPAFNCAETLPLALTSVLNQTWANLEVLIVDDRSQDDTWQVIQEFARRDSRVVPIRHQQNGGAYAARNTALAEASGDFVTVHDADDWSHPEKFAAQMAYALSQPDGISTTMGVRVSRDFRFKVNASAGGMLMQNTSSLLAQRQILTDLGGWDRTRVAADSELYERVRARHNLQTNKLFPHVPLTLILFSGSSLTQTTAAGIDTVNYGARRQYKEAYRFWHAAELAKPKPDLRMTPERRFLAPRVILGQKELITDIDVIVVGDFSDHSRCYGHDIAQWNTLAGAGLRLGIVHWPAYERAGVNVAHPVRFAIAAGLIENVVPGETVSCKAVVVLDNSLLDTPPAPLPNIRAAQLYVMAENDGLSVRQDEASRRCFGCAPITIGKDYVTPTLGGLKAIG